MQSLRQEVLVSYTERQKKVEMMLRTTTITLKHTFCTAQFYQVLNNKSLSFSIVLSQNMEKLKLLIRTW